MTQAEFDAAQVATPSSQPRNGSLSAQALLVGLLRCAGCGHTLKISGTTNKKTGERHPELLLQEALRNRTLPAPASARASTIDPYVEEQVVAALKAKGGLLAEARAAHERLEELVRQAAADHELDTYLNSSLITVIGEARFMEGVEGRQTALDSARTELAELRSQSAIVNDLTDGNLLRAWPELSTPEKRTLLHGLLDKVVLTSAGGKRRWAAPIAERAEIVLRGGSSLS